jgi:D-tyrosyl-tRNA(Tyr) deacylase
MRIVVQRVSRASVRVAGETVSEIGRGLLVLVGIERGDGPAQIERAAHRLVSLRVFEDGGGHMNLGLDEVAGEVLVVSQFTLAGSIRRGRRPDFVNAARDYWWTAWWLPCEPEGCGCARACFAPTWRWSWSTTGR